MILRPYQEQTLGHCRDHFLSKCRAVLVVAPTGSGKTCMGGAMVRGHVQRGGHVVWLAHRLELVEQAARTLHSLGLEVGYRGLSASAPVQVCMVQTLARRDVAPDGTLVIADEAHHFASGNDWTRLTSGYLAAGAWLVGLTATPARADGKALPGFEVLVVSTSIRQLVSEGHLVPLRWKGPSAPTPKDRLARTPADAWRRYAGSRPTVVFAPHVQAAEEYAAEFRASGVRCEVVSERSTPEMRASTLHGLEAGAIDVVCNVQVLTEGWDCPRVSCVIVARRVGSQSLWIQMTGRGLRPHQGKTDCLLLDLCGMAHILGLPDEDRTYSLSGEGITLSRPVGTRVRVCKRCGAPLDPGVRLCAECGKDHSLVTPIAIGSDLEDWRQAYVAARDTIRPNKLTTAFAGMLRKSKSDAQAAWMFRRVFGRMPDARLMQQARALNDSAATEMQRRRLGDGW